MCLLMVLFVGFCLLLKWKLTESRHSSAMENLELVILYCRIITKENTAISDSLDSLKAK